MTRPFATASAPSRAWAQGAVEAIVGERRAHGDFSSLEDLCRRLDLSKINRRVLEALIKSGSLDGLAANRATLMHRLDAALALGEQNSKANETGQHDIFGLARRARSRSGARHRAGPAGMDRQRAAACRARDAGPRNLRSSHRPLRERSAAVHHRPHRRLHRRRQARRPAPKAAARSSVASRWRLPAWSRNCASAVRAPRSCWTTTPAACRWDSSTSTIQQYREILVKDALLLIEGKLRFDEFANTWVLRANKVSELERLREKEARRIVLKVKSTDSLPLDKLQAMLAQYRGGGCQVAVQFLRRRCARHVFLRRRMECPAGAGPDRRAREVVGSRPDRGALQPAAGERRSQFHQR